MCGETAADDVAGVLSPSMSVPGPSGTQREWSIPQPWSSDGRAFTTPFQEKGKRPQDSGTTYEPFLKRSFPQVTLAMAGRSIIVDTILNNIYVRVPESAVSVPAILSEVAKKMGVNPEDLVVLDSKILRVSDDKGMYSLVLCSIVVKSHCVCMRDKIIATPKTDLEYWKCPSRRLYVAKQCEYDRVMREKEKGKRHLASKQRRIEDEDRHLEDSENIRQVSIVSMIY